MRSQQYQCGICGYIITSLSKDPASFKPICPECGEMNRLIPLSKGLERFFARFPSDTQSMTIKASFITKSPVFYCTTKNDKAGCNRIPTCCGLATPCDAPPRYCEELRAIGIVNHNRKLYSLRT